MNTYIITIILSVIVFLYIGIRRIKKIKNDKDFFGKEYEINQEYWGILFKVLAVNLLVYPFIYFIVANFSKKNEIGYSRSNIVSVNVNNRIEGDFILGSGTIKQRRVYILMEDLGGSRYKERNIPVKNTIIYEDINDSKRGYIEETVCDYERSEYYDINKLRWRKGCFNIYLDEKEYEDDKAYRLHVPIGTIIKEMRVN